MNNNHQYVFKIIVVGDCRVGKSCLQMRFTDNIFKDIHDLTIGVEFASKNICVDDLNIKLQIWDTAGQENFKAITKNYYRGSTGCIIVYDISLRTTFLNVRRWLEDIRSANINNQLKIVLVGNKTDLSLRREVSFEEAKQFADENNMLFFECSCKNNYNVVPIFYKLTEIILNSIKNGEIQDLKESGIKMLNIHKHQEINNQANLKCCSIL